MTQWLIEEAAFAALNHADERDRAAASEQPEEQQRTNRLLELAARQLRVGRA